MIKFFSKTRHNLMNQNKTSKYLKYAIGEIILVVVGILIALQINNWNENRKDGIEEQALLQQLHSEFSSNLSQLDQKIEIRKQMIAASLQLLSYVDNPQGVSSDSIYKYIGPTCLAPTFDPIVNDISSSGRIQLLKNPKLKELLSRWTSEIVQVTEEESAWVRSKESHYIPFLLEFGSIRSILNTFWIKNSIEIFHLDEGTKTELNLGDSKRDFDITKILKNPRFEDHVSECASFSKLTNSQSYSLRKRIVEILNLIEQDLK